MSLELQEAGKGSSDAAEVPSMPHPRYCVIRAQTVGEPESTAVGRCSRSWRQTGFGQLPWGWFFENFW
jgi:hypothetical protein